MQLFIHFVLKQPYGVSILPYELIYRDSVDCRDVTPMPLFVGSVPVFLYLSFQLRSASRLKRSECTSTGAFALSRVPVLLHLLVHANLSFFSPSNARRHGGELASLPCTPLSLSVCSVFAYRLVHGYNVLGRGIVLQSVRWREAVTPSLHHNIQCFTATPHDIRRRAECHWASSADAPVKGKPSAALILFAKPTRSVSTS
jgi:hypothetical protein